MKHFDENVTDEERDIRNKFIEERWSQLYELSKETTDSAIRYLFTTNAGGAVAVLAYLGTISDSTEPTISSKIALILFFLGLLFVGFYRAYMVHRDEDLFEHIQNVDRELLQ